MRRGRRRPTARSPALLRVSTCASPSKRLHELDDRVFLLRVELGAVNVSTVAVARQRGVVEKELTPREFSHVGDEADLHAIEQLVASIEALGPLFGPVQ